MGTIVIIAETLASDLEEAKATVRRAARDAAGVYGLTDLRVTHFRSEDGDVYPDGMAHQTAEEILAPSAVEPVSTTETPEGGWDDEAITERFNALNAGLSRIEALLTRVAS